MEQLFLKILSMNIAASYVILVVIAVRLLLKKAPAVCSYILWLAVLIRLVCPFSFESIFSLVPAGAQTVPHGIISSQTPGIQNGGIAVGQTVNQAMSVTPATAGTDPLHIWVSLGASVWLLGIAVLILYSFFTSIKLSRSLKPARLFSDNTYETDRIKTPFVFGLFKPRIYLPDGLGEREKEYIIKHEQTHIRRLDHLIKLIAFLVLCVHWFNPLVWVAFHLMCGDMEQSCDESVIKQMGSEIKKDYSASLLALSARRHRIGGCPLAFGESNTKKRIRNILNYKKPAFWVVVVGVIAAAAVIAGLVSDPKGEQLTVEDYADQFVAAQISALENSPDVKIMDSKITRLEKLGAYDGLLSSPVEIWLLEYRLLPEDINKVVIAGGMSVEDGWITEWGSPGQPVLVFAVDGKKLEYLGSDWTGEEDYSTDAGRETALRTFLEGIGKLPHETYPGNHVLVKFPLSSGDTSQLFLSQPVTQGDGGIWCVERWKDTNGNEYYVTPPTAGRHMEYYKELQKQCDRGEQSKSYLLDPVQTALAFINNNEIGIFIGPYQVSPESLEVKYEATAGDFAVTPLSYYIGYISNFTLEEPYFHLDQIEWLTSEGDADRLKALGVDPDKLTNGYYIYNPATWPMYVGTNDETVYSIVDWEGSGNAVTNKEVSKKEFLDHLNKYSGFSPPFRIVTQNGYALSVTEQYVP